MKIGIVLVLAASISACSVVSAGEQPENTYCLEEQEKDGYDFMVVVDNSVCDLRDDDVEIYTTTDVLSLGDIAYVESDREHSKAKPRSKTSVVAPKTTPNYTPAKPTQNPTYKPPATKVCKIGYVKPAPPTQPGC